MRMVRKFGVGFLSLILLLLLTSSLAGAADSSRQFNFTAEVNGSTTVSVKQGDTITVDVFLELKNASADYDMYSLQDEISFETQYFEVIESSLKADSSYNFKPPFIRDWSDQGLKKVVFSFITDNLAGTQFAPQVTLGSFQLKALTTGTTTIDNTNYEVGTYDGMDTFEANGNQVTVTITGGGGGGGSSGGSGSSSQLYTNIVAANTVGADGANLSEAGGTVVLSPVSAREGATVTFTITPKDGYILTDLKVVDAKGNAVSFIDKKNGIYTFVQPASAVTIKPTFTQKATALETPVTPETPVVPETPIAPETINPDNFTDIRNHWAEEYIDYAVRHNLFKGVTATTFEPDTPTNRAMLLTTLYNLAGQPSGAAVSGFRDVVAGSWYEQPVNWGYANGVIKGYGDGTFAPLKLVSREEMVTILHNYYHFINPNLTEEVQGDLSRFQDLAEMSAYAQESMSWAVGSGLVTGRGDDLLCPTASSTRAEVATVLSLFLQKVLDY